MIHQAAAFIVRHFVRRQPSPMADAHDAPLVRLSCFHGDGKWTDFVQGRWAADPCAPIEAAYADAVGRLPVDEMPDLFDCLYRGGNCVGLLDPASNVILNGLTLLCRRRSSAYSLPEEGRFPLPPDPRHVSVWGSIAYRSYLGLTAFMHTYFPYLTEDQARFYLHLSGGDLLVAIRIAELEQFAAVKGAVDQDTVGRHPDLLRERAQFALAVAGIKAKHPMPDDLQLLCRPALQESEDGMKAVLATLEEGRRLTVHDVEAIIGVLKSQLRHRTVIPALRLTSTQRGRGETLHYRLNGLQFQQCAPFSLASLRSPEAMRRKLESCLALVPEHTPHTPAEVADAPPTCGHIAYLKMGLLDVIHALYVEALARLPRAALRRLLRGVLVAGHCYGPMDPVSNIIIHAAWYSVVAPPLRPSGEPDILGVDARLRLEVRSLEGLAAAVRAATGFSEHKAVEHLSTNRCDISDTLRRAAPERRGQAFRRASEAAKHPLGEHHSSFLASLASSGPKILDTLSTLLRSGEDEGPRHVISDASITELQKMLGCRCSSITPLPVPAPNHLDGLAAKKYWLERRQRFLRTELEQLLRGYADQHPWEPTFELETICGVHKETAYLSSHCYHINFLAAASDGTRMLFFAEVWEEKRPDNTEPCSVRWGVRFNDRESEVSFCCPLPYGYYSPNDAYLGRCTICEFGMSKIVHPPVGLHIGATHADFGKTRPLASDLKHADGIVDTELIYCDDPTDSHFANALNESCPSANLDKSLGIMSLS